jgi:hypothetical protein
MIQFFVFVWAILFSQFSLAWCGFELSFTHQITLNKNLALKHRFLTGTESPEPEVRMRSIQDDLFSMSEVDADVLRRTVNLLADPDSIVRIHAYEYLEMHPDFGIDALLAARGTAILPAVFHQGITRELLVSHPADSFQLMNLAEIATENHQKNLALPVPLGIEQEFVQVEDWAINLGHRPAQSDVLARRLLSLNLDFRYISEAILATNLDFGSLTEPQKSQVIYNLVRGLSHPYSKEIRANSRKLLVQWQLMSPREVLVFRLIRPQQTLSSRSPLGRSLWGVGLSILKRTQRLSPAAFEALLITRLSVPTQIDFWLEDPVQEAFDRVVRNHPDVFGLAKTLIAFVLAYSKDGARLYGALRPLADRISRLTTDQKKELAGMFPQHVSADLLLIKNHLGLRLIY